MFLSELSMRLSISASASLVSFGSITLDYLLVYGGQHCNRSKRVRNALNTEEVFFVRLVNRLLILRRIEVVTEVLTRRVLRVKQIRRLAFNRVDEPREVEQILIKQPWQPWVLRTRAALKRAIVWTLELPLRALAYVRARLTVSPALPTPAAPEPLPPGTASAIVMAMQPAPQRPQFNQTPYYVNNSQWAHWDAVQREQDAAAQIAMTSYMRGGPATWNTVCSTGTATGGDWD
jgi:hypothetical protein